MPRPRYQIAEEDVPVVHRWVHAKLRDTTSPQHDAGRTAWGQVPREREPFYDVVEPRTRTVYVNDPANIAGVGALLDSLLSSGR